MDRLPTRYVDALARFRACVRRRYRIDKIVLFGSWVWGHPTDLSDLDVLVVSPDFSAGKRLDAIEYLADAVVEAGEGGHVPISAIPVSPELWAGAGPDRWLWRVKQEGVVWEGPS